MDVPLWSECRQRNVIRQRILIHHKKEITSVLIWKKRAAIWINLNMYCDKINAVFASNHHAILSKCYERYLNDAVLMRLSLLRETPPPWGEVGDLTFIKANRPWLGDNNRSNVVRPPPGALGGI